MSMPQVLLSIVVASIHLYSLTDCESGKLRDFGFNLTFSLLFLGALLNYFVHLGYKVETQFSSLLYLSLYSLHALLHPSSHRPSHYRRRTSRYTLTTSRWRLPPLHGTSDYLNQKEIRRKTVKGKQKSRELNKTKQKEKKKKRNLLLR
ncbi:hypothetical protein P8452_20847 [Trifolium repens]|nr:hypothetical protein P8452_20847 [Trifolium repens]